MSRALTTTLIELALIALPVLVGFLAGLHIRQRRLDQVERDAWHDGAEWALRHFSIWDDRTSQWLDAAVQHAHPSDQPWLN